MSGVIIVKENNQKIKLVKLLDYLRAESSANAPVSTNNIIQYLNSINITCDRRTLYKDMDMLIDNGANIIKTELGRENAYYIDDASLSLAELKLLINAVQAANFITDKKTAELMEKLISLSGSRRSEIVRDNIICYNNHKHSRCRTPEYRWPRHGDALSDGLYARWDCRSRACDEEKE